MPGWAGAENWPHIFWKSGQLGPSLRPQEQSTQQTRPQEAEGRMETTHGEEDTGRARGWEVGRGDSRKGPSGWRGEGGEHQEAGLGLGG